jgi:hypothetical protein
VAINVIDNPKILRLFTPVLIYIFTNPHMNRWEIETILHLGDGVIRITYKFRERIKVND